MDRRNGRIYLLSYLLIYLAAPVIYIGVVQAALLDKLGAGATVSNLPFAAYQLGQFAPLIVSWLVPHRVERWVVVWANVVTAILLSLTALVLTLPATDSMRIAAVIFQGLLQGLAASSSQIFQLQCLGRGTTLEGRARALKLTFTLGPVTAVLGSLGAQFVLNPGIPGLTYPRDFGLLYALGVPCMLGVAILSSRYMLLPVEDEVRQPFFSFLSGSLRDYLKSRPLVLLGFAYLLWYSTLGGMPNLSLYTKEALRRDPKDFSGLIMALRFGCKSLGGFLLGAITLRWGFRAGALTAIGLLAAGVVWGWMVPGYGYLFAFGLMGAGELGGAYIPTYALSLSSMEAGPRNLSILTLATAASSYAPALHGALTDRFSFAASFAFGLAAAAVAFVLVRIIPKSAAAKP
jgi:hypothetical protein